MRIQKGRCRDKKRGGEGGGGELEGREQPKKQRIGSDQRETGGKKAERRQGKGKAKRNPLESRRHHRNPYAGSPVNCEESGRA
jgi:hypothetical protein